MSVDPAWVALSLVEHLGGIKLRSLLVHFNSDLHAILNADETTLRRVRGIGAKDRRQASARLIWRRPND